MEAYARDFGNFNETYTDFYNAATRPSLVDGKQTGTEAKSTERAEPPTRIELPKTPMPEQRESKVKRIVDNAEKNKTDNVIQASKDIIKAEIEIAKPYDKKTLQNTSTDKLIKWQRTWILILIPWKESPLKKNLCVKL